MKTLTRFTLALTLIIAACDGADPSSGDAAGGTDVQAGGAAQGADAAAASQDVGASNNGGAGDVATPSEDAGAADDAGALDPAGADAAAAAADVSSPHPTIDAGTAPTEPQVDLYNDPNVQCPPLGETGKNIGDVLPQVKLKTCDGKPFYFTELCGAQAYWIFQTAGWCPHCANTAKTLKNIPQSYFDSGVWIIVNVLRDQNDKVASADYCKSYAKIYKIPEDRILMAVDPTQTTKKFNTTGGVPFHVVLDRDQVIRYMWSGGDTSNTALAYIKIILKEQAEKDAAAATE